MIKIMDGKATSNKILEEESNNNVAIGMLNVLCYILARIKKRNKELNNNKKLR